MDITTVGAALEILSKASKALDSLREQAKRSKDADLKENISKLYDDFLDMKAAVLRLTEENGALRLQIAKGVEKPLKPEIRQIGSTNYYYVGDEGPYCQPCYDQNEKLVRLTPQKDFNTGRGRNCEVCGKLFFESRETRSHNPVALYGEW